MAIFRTIARHLHPGSGASQRNVPACEPATLLQAIRHPLFTQLISPTWHTARALLQGRMGASRTRSRRTSAGTTCLIHTVPLAVTWTVAHGWAVDQSGLGRCVAVCHAKEIRSHRRHCAGGGSVRQRACRDLPWRASTGFIPVGSQLASYHHARTPCRSCPRANQHTAGLRHRIKLRPVSASASRRFVSQRLARQAHFAFNSHEPATPPSAGMNPARLRERGEQ